MKYFVCILALIITHGIALGATARPTPVSGHKIPKTPMDKLQQRIQHQTSQIQRELKLGKLKAAQAKTLRDQIASIRKTEMADLKADNSKTLTDAQLADLNHQLDTLSKSVPIPLVQIPAKK